MTGRTGTGWQYVMTDLSMILFMITAAAVADAPPDPPLRPAAPALPALGEPVAVWSGESGGALVRWLGALPPDPRQRLTIVAPTAASAAALELARAAGRPARIVLEPGAAGPPVATLTYDIPPEGAER